MAGEQISTGTDTGVSAPLPDPILASQGPPPEAAASPATTPTSPTSGFAPSPYNPLAAQPYSAPIANPVSQLPQNQLPPDQPANGAVSHTGAAAYGIDQVLRGFMRGRAQAQVVQGIQLAKQSQGLQQNLDAASQEYYALSKAGTDPNSQQMQDAKSRVDAAWQANLDFMKQHVAGEQIDKKTGQLKPQSGNILSRLTNSADPAAQPIAAYQAAQKLGPPVYHQTAAFQTPAYQAYAKTQAQTAGATAQAGLLQQQSAVQKQGFQNELNTLNAIPPDKLTDEQRDRRDQLGDILQQPTEAAAAKSELIRRVMAMPIPADEPARSNALASQARLIQQISGKGQGAFTPTARLATAGSLGEVLDRVAADHGMARGQLPVAVTEAYRQRVAYDQHVATSTTRTQMMDTVDPVTHQPTKTPVSLPGSTTPGPRPAIPTGWGDPAEAAIPSNVTHLSAIAAGTEAYTRTLNAGHTPAQASTVAKVASSAAQRSLNVQTGTPIPTGKNRQQTPDETEAYKDENNIGVHLTAAEQAAHLPDRSAGDTALSTQFAHSLVNGRLSNFDIQRFSNLGSARMRMEGSVMKSIDGTMTDEQRNMILDNMRINYQAAHTLAEKYRKGTPGVGQRSSTAGGGAMTPVANDPLGIR